MIKRLHSHWMLFIGTVLLVLIVAAPILSYPMGRDQGMYANIGRSILYGGVPFVDMWDIKPPPIYYIYAAGIAIFGTTTQAIRALDLTLVPFGMLGLYLLGGKMANRRIGLFAALLYGLFYFNDGFQNLSQSDSLATIPTIWAAYFTYKASQSESGLWSSLIVGLISGLLLWFKPQQYALVVGAFVLYHILQRVNNIWRTRYITSLQGLLKEGIVFAIGGLLTGGTLLAYFWSQGIIQEIFIIAEGTAAYNAQGYDLSAFIDNMRQGFYFRWTVWHLLIVLTGLWIVYYLLSTLKRGRARRPSPTNNGESAIDHVPTNNGAQRPSPTNNGGADAIHHVPTNNRAQRPSPTDSSRLLILWLLSGLGFAFIQAKGFDTHWFPMLPPMAVMGAIVIDNLIARIQPKNKSALYLIIVIGLSAIPAWTTWGQAWAYLSNQQSQYDYWDTFQANDLKPEQSLAMATFLRERVETGNSLFIWGFRPEVYFMAELWPATRYQAHFPLIAPWYPVEWQQNNVDSLWAAMPPYALVLEDDFMPWVTDFDADSHTLLQDYTELNNWLIANYEREGQIGDFIIWRRATP